MQRIPPHHDETRWECDCRAMNSKKAIRCKACHDHRFGKDK